MKSPVFRLISLLLVLSMLVDPSFAFAMQPGAAAARRQTSVFSSQALTLTLAAAAFYSAIQPHSHDPFIKTMGYNPAIVRRYGSRRTRRASTTPRHIDIPELSHSFDLMLSDPMNFAGPTNSIGVDFHLWPELLRAVKVYRDRADLPPLAPGLETQAYRVEPPVYALAALYANTGIHPVRVYSLLMSQGRRPYNITMAKIFVTVAPWLSWHPSRAEELWQILAERFPNDPYIQQIRSIPSDQEVEESGATLMLPAIDVDTETALLEKLTYAIQVHGKLLRTHFIHGFLKKPGLEFSVHDLKQMRIIATGLGRLSPYFEDLQQLTIHTAADTVFGILKAVNATQRVTEAPKPENVPSVRYLQARHKSNRPAAKHLQEQMDCFYWFQALFETQGAVSRAMIFLHVMDTQVSEQFKTAYGTMMDRLSEEIKLRKQNYLSHTQLQKIVREEVEEFRKLWDSGEVGFPLGIQYDSYWGQVYARIPEGPEHQWRRLLIGGVAIPIVETFTFFTLRLPEVYGWVRALHVQHKNMQKQKGSSVTARRSIRLDIENALDRLRKDFYGAHRSAVFLGSEQKPATYDQETMTHSQWERIQKPIRDLSYDLIKPFSMAVDLVPFQIAITLLSVAMIAIAYRMPDVYYLLAGLIVCVELLMPSLYSAVVHARHNIRAIRASGSTPLAIALQTNSPGSPDNRFLQLLEIAVERVQRLGQRKASVQYSRVGGRVDIAFKLPADGSLDSSMEELSELAWSLRIPTIHAGLYVSFLPELSRLSKAAFRSSLPRRRQTRETTLVPVTPPFQAGTPAAKVMLEHVFARLQAIGSGQSFLKIPYRTIARQLGMEIIDDPTFALVSANLGFVILPRDWERIQKYREQFKKRYRIKSTIQWDDLLNAYPKLAYQAPELTIHRPELLKLHPAIHRPGIYLNGVYLDRRSNAEAISTVFHELMEHEADQAGLLDRDFLQAFGHAHPWIPLLEIYFSAFVSSQAFLSSLEHFANEVAREKARIDPWSRSFQPDPWKSRGFNQSVKASMVLSQRSEAWNLAIEEERNPEIRRKHDHLRATIQQLETLLQAARASEDPRALISPLINREDSSPKRLRAPSKALLLSLVAITGMMLWSWLGDSLAPDKLNVLTASLPLFFAPVDGGSGGAKDHTQISSKAMSAEREEKVTRLQKDFDEAIVELEKYPESRVIRVLIRFGIGYLAVALYGGIEALRQSIMDPALTFLLVSATLLVGMAGSIAILVYFSVRADSFSKRIYTAIEGTSRTDPLASAAMKQRYEDVTKRLRLRKPAENTARAPIGHGVLDANVPQDELDAQTVRDLHLQDMSQLFNRESTALGAERLQYLVTHSYLDPEFIRERQVATGELVNTPALRHSLSRWMSPFHTHQSMGLLTKSLAHRNTFRVTMIKLQISLGLWRPSPATETYWIRNEWRFLLKSVDHIRPHLAAADAPFLKRALREIDQLFDPSTPNSLADLKTHFGYTTLHHAYQHQQEQLQRLAGLFAELEVLNWLAQGAVDQRGSHVLPVPLKQEAPELEIIDGHPTWIPEGVSVPNDITLRPGENLGIITGANMNGKSTLLRAVGVMTILAQLGSPVRARAMRWTPVRVRSQISMEDVPAEGKSLFDVETSRLAETLHLVEPDPFYLLLFDEILRGTNEPDKLKVQRAVIPFLKASRALTLIATHDLSLSQIPGVKNDHFEEDYSGAVSRFTYRLHPGPVTSTNAIRVFADKIPTLKTILQALNGPGSEKGVGRWTVVAAMAVISLALLISLGPSMTGIAFFISVGGSIYGSLALRDLRKAILQQKETGKSLQDLEREERRNWNRIQTLGVESPNDMEVSTVLDWSRRLQLWLSVKFYGGMSVFNLWFGSYVYSATGQPLALAALKVTGTAAAFVAIIHLLFQEFPAKPRTSGGMIVWIFRGLALAGIAAILNAWFGAGSMGLASLPFLPLWMPEDSARSGASDDTLQEIQRIAMPSAYAASVKSHFEQTDPQDPVHLISRAHHSVAYMPLLKAIFRHVGSLKGKKILELGAGPGVVVERLREVAGAEASGLEVQEPFVEFARAHGIPLDQSHLLNVPESQRGSVYDVTYSNLLLDALGTLQVSSDGTRTFDRFDHGEELAVLLTIANLTAPGGWSIHRTQYPNPLPYSDAELSDAGFEIVEKFPEQGLVVLRRADLFKKILPAREGLLALKARIKKLADNNLSNPQIYNLHVMIDGPTSRPGRGTGKTTFSVTAVEHLPDIPGWNITGFEAKDRNQDASLNKTIIINEHWQAATRTDRPVTANTHDVIVYLVPSFGFFNEGAIKKADFAIDWRPEVRPTPEEMKSLWSQPWGEDTEERVEPRDTAPEPRPGNSQQRRTPMGQSLDAEQASPWDAMQAPNEKRYAGRRLEKPAHQRARRPVVSQVGTSAVPPAVLQKRAHLTQLRSALEQEISWLFFEAFSPWAGSALTLPITHSALKPHEHRLFDLMERLRRIMIDEFVVSDDWHHFMSLSRTHTPDCGMCHYVNSLLSDALLALGWPAKLHFTIFNDQSLHVHVKVNNLAIDLAAGQFFPDRIRSIVVDRRHVYARFLVQRVPPILIEFVSDESRVAAIRRRYDRARQNLHDQLRRAA